ncbi:peptidase [Pantoea sp. JZ29]|uniref:DUF2268 domain-containing putative Zn-dependent protease n=1 Tax=Pantoea sp. JZ29 TaxID=2654192 RepID=UPI002B47BD57|nr:DUF2268 domain-containing putative Zn-dependent protease [Pantoea sp. JZ29]WRH21107.1 peptidase [Pantoea sp. JZ29]
MSYMMLHFLDAQKTLTAHSDWIKDCLTATHRRADSLMSLPALDVVVKTGNRVVPEKGHSGFCPEPGIVYVTVDPDNPAFCQNAAQSLERMFAHELHHAARWAGPGYGTTLGEACVSEGLAGHFVLELFGGEPERWECINAELIHAYLPQLHQDWLCTDYDHSKWFYGAGDMPRWLGYTLGFNLVASYLAARPERRASQLAHTEADSFSVFI